MSQPETPSPEAEPTSAATARPASAATARPASPFSRPVLAWTALAVLLFSAGVLRQFGGLLEHDLGEVVAYSTPTPWRSALKHDASYVSWVVGRNARTLSTQPWRLFHAEPCAPAEQALALGEPAVSLGLLGVPSWLATRDPIRTFNLTLLALCFTAPMAMFLLVWSWTGQPAAGIVAGLAFGFQAMRVHDPLHPYLWDYTATVLALLFARRLLSQGRWRDAAGLGACIAFQLGGSLYALLGSALIAAPILAWLLLGYGLRALRPGPVALVMGIAAGSALLFLAPALGMVESGALVAREKQSFLAGSTLLPGGWAFPGWPLLAFALLGIVLPLRSDAGPARWALLTGAALVTWFAAGPSAAPLPDLYHLADALLPGLEVVRAPNQIQLAALLPLSALAGLGAAAGLQRVPERLRSSAAVCLAVAAALLTLRPGAPGLAPSDTYGYLHVRPKTETLRFFEQLEALGNDGPLYELPPPTLREQGRGVLLTEFHRRRSSACAGSFTPQIRELEGIAARLPDAGAVRDLAAAGFTTILVHRRIRPGYAERFRESLSALDQPLLREVLSDDRTTAYVIELP